MNASSLALGCVVCIAACFLTLGLLGRARAQLGSPGHSTRIWLAATVFGCGVLATHILTGQGVSIEAPVFVLDTAALLAMAVIGSGLGFMLGFRPGLPAGGLAIAGSTNIAIFYIDRAWLTRADHVAWDGSLVVASILIGVILAALAGLAATFIRRTGPRLAAAGLLSLSVLGAQIAGLTAQVSPANGLSTSTGDDAGPLLLAVTVSLLAIMIIGLGIVGAVVNRQIAAREKAESARLRAYVADLEASQSELQETSRRLHQALSEASAAEISKSQFLAAMSHELRTPLNAIIGFSEIMKTRLFGPHSHDRYGEYAEDIHRSGTHLLALINDVLDLTRLDAAELTLSEEEIDLGELISEALRMVANHAAASEIAISKSIGPQILVRGDERRLRQILLNLLSNAVKFTQGGGSVHVRTAVNAHGLLIEIQDTGIGMSPEDIPKALQRFGQIDSRLARRYEGAGLGLSLVKELVELHGGQFRLESELDVGTTASVLLPLHRLAGLRQAA